jgi:transposase
VRLEAYDVATGRVLGKSHARHRSQEFLKFLKEIDLAWPDDGNELHVVMDNYATHKTEKVQRWLGRHLRFKIHFTPTGASWINLVERFFGKITSEAIRRGSFASTKQLKVAMDDFIQMHNEDLAQVLIRKARRYFNGLDIDELVYAVDASTIDLCLAMFPWAHFRKTKAAIKLHTQIDLTGSIPVFIKITDGSVHDVHFMAPPRIGLSEKGPGPF